MLESHDEFEALAAGIEIGNDDFSERYGFRTISLEFCFLKLHAMCNCDKCAYPDSRHYRGGKPDPSKCARIER